MHNPLFRRTPSTIFRRALTCSVLAISHSAASLAADIEEITVIALRENRTSAGATGLTLSLHDTPQSISLISKEQMARFGADSLNDALRLAPGIQVEEWETNRTNFTSRGFDIRNTQIDGVGMPNNWGIVTGAMDSYGYESIEIIRGANGMLTGVGNAAGTLNYLRKRPLNETRGHVGVSLGEFDTYRVEADYSTPLAANREWAGRVVGAFDSEGSHLAGLSNQRGFVYAVVDGQVGEKGTLTLGGSHQDANTQGNLWGGLVLVQKDGTQAEFHRSVSTSQDWTYWNTINQSFFTEYQHQFSPGWQGKLSYNFRRASEDDQLFYVYTSEGLDPISRTGLTGWPGAYATNAPAHLAEASLNGAFEAWGLEHQLFGGLSFARGKETMYNRAANSEVAFGALPPFPYALNAIPEPIWGSRQLYSDTSQEITRLFTALRLNYSENLFSIWGLNHTTYHREGVNSAKAFDQTEREPAPYASLVYALNPNINLYASYSDVYEPQDRRNIVGDYLAPTKGVNYEFGLKAQALDQRLAANLAWFTADQQNLGTFAGMQGGESYYAGKDVTSKGIDLELTGQLTETTTLSANLVSLQLEDNQGNETYPWIPRETFKMALSHRFAGIGLEVGANLRWQNKVAKQDDNSNLITRQNSYAVADVFARWALTNSLQLSLNLNNLSDEQYLTSLYQVGYYAAPRTASLGLDMHF